MIFIKHINNFLTLFSKSFPNLPQKHQFKGKSGFVELCCETRVESIFLDELNRHGDFDTMKNNENSGGAFA